MTRPQRDIPLDLPTSMTTAKPVPVVGDGTRRLRSILYLRVSGKDQVNTDYDPEGISLPAQRRKTREKAQQLNTDVVGEYIEPGRSAYKDLEKREAFRQMLDRIERERDVDMVIVYQLSRFARNRYEDAIFSMALRRLGVQLVSATENIDESPVGMLVHGILSSVNEFQSAASGKDISFKMSEKARKGGTPGLAPIGYLNIRERFDGREIRSISLDPDRWEHVRWAWEEFATGRYTLASMTTALQARGLTNRATTKYPERPLNKSHVHKILTNPYYIGCVRFDGVLYENGRHPVFISRETFDQVQAVLRARNKTGDKPQRHFHHLKGSLFCGECGSRMGIINATGRWGGIYPYFYCLGRQRDTRSCTQPYIRVELVEREVEQWWTRISLTDTQRAHIRSLVITAARTIATHGHAEATRQKKKITSLDEERRKLLRLHLNDTVDEDLFKEEQERLRRALDAARRLLDTCQAQWKTIEDAIDRIMLLCEDSHTLYRTAPDSVKQQLNQATFHRFYVLGHTLAGADPCSPLAQLLAEDLDVRLAHETRSLIEDTQDPENTAETDQHDDDPRPHGQAPSLAGRMPRQRPYGPLPIEKDQPRSTEINRGSNMATL
ncbi:recombinase family protein, partial [Frankia sp. Cj3]|uniref:recombinase family protein n=1 Tax=Frankia sp. Cj3 TaxID=2880976 RepID=UPI001EF429FC